MLEENWRPPSRPVVLFISSVSSVLKETSTWIKWKYLFNALKLFSTLLTAAFKSFIQFSAKNKTKWKMIKTVRQSVCPPWLNGGMSFWNHMTPVTWPVDAVAWLVTAAGETHEEETHETSVQTWNHLAGRSTSLKPPESTCLLRTPDRTAHLSITALRGLRALSLTSQAAHALQLRSQTGSEWVKHQRRAGAVFSLRLLKLVGGGTQPGSPNSGQTCSVPTGWNWRRRAAFRWSEEQTETNLFLHQVVSLALFRWAAMLTLSIKFQSQLNAASSCPTSPECIIGPNLNIRNKMPLKFKFKTSPSVVSVELISSSALTSNSLMHRKIFWGSCDVQVQVTEINVLKLAWMFGKLKHKVWEKPLRLTWASRKWLQTTWWKDYEQNVKQRGDVCFGASVGRFLFGGKQSISTFASQEVDLSLSDWLHCSNGRQWITIHFKTLRRKLRPPVFILTLTKHFDLWLGTASIRASMMLCVVMATHTFQPHIYIYCIRLRYLQDTFVHKHLIRIRTVTAEQDSSCRPHTVF